MLQLHDKHINKNKLNLQQAVIWLNWINTELMNSSMYNLRSAVCMSQLPCSLFAYIAVSDKLLNAYGAVGQHLYWLPWQLLYNRIVLHCSVLYNQNDCMLYQSVSLCLFVCVCKSHVPLHPENENPAGHVWGHQWHVPRLFMCPGGIIGCQTSLRLSSMLIEFLHLVKSSGKTRVHLFASRSDYGLFHSAQNCVHYDGFCAFAVEFYCILLSC